MITRLQRRARRQAMLVDGVGGAELRRHRVHTRRRASTRPRAARDRSCTARHATPPVWAMHRTSRMAGRQPADQRAAETEARMTDEERFALVVAVMGAATQPSVREDIPASAGYTAGVPRLSVPALRMTDGPATALPAPIALGATFDLQLAREVGVVLGREARAR